MISNLLSYLLSSGATIAPGDTMETGPDTFLRTRSPKHDDYFLETEGEILVLEKISKNETYRH